jgi:YafQ family addiction module toxin component
MAFLPAPSESFEKELGKLSAKNPVLKKAVKGKLEEILEDPFRFKPLKAPLQGFRRVHILKCFVLIYRINEAEKTVELVKIKHHDEAYEL